MERFTSLGFSAHDAMMLSDAYDAITVTDLWEYFRRPSTPGKDGFMFSTDPELSALHARLLLVKVARQAARCRLVRVRRVPAALRVPQVVCDGAPQRSV